MTNAHQDRMIEQAIGAHEALVLAVRAHAKTQVRIAEAMEKANAIADEHNRWIRREEA